MTRPKQPSAGQPVKQLKTMTRKIREKGPERKTNQIWTACIVYFHWVKYSGVYIHNKIIGIKIKTDRPKANN